MTCYNFRETADFLNRSVPLDDIYDEICKALRLLRSERLSKKKRTEISLTLHTCADFLDTIEVK